MKNAFVAVRRARTADGELEIQDGAFFLEPHPHPVFQVKDQEGNLVPREFTGQGELVQAVVDYQNQARDPQTLLRAGALAKEGKNEEALALMESLSPAPIGEVILLNVLEF